jgi:hypothetical protein
MFESPVRRSLDTVVGGLTLSGFLLEECVCGDAVRYRAGIVSSAGEMLTGYFRRRHHSLRLFLEKCGNAIELGAGCVWFASEILAERKWLDTQLSLAALRTSCSYLQVKIGNKPGQPVRYSKSQATTSQISPRTHRHTIEYRTD